MKYNPEIHNRKSIRIAGYNYSTPGAYFITICTHNRELLFGDVRHGIIIIDDINDDCGGIDGNGDTNGHGDTNGCRGTMHRAPTERNIITNPIQTIEQFGKPTSNTIPTIIRGYKSSVTKQTKILNENPQMRIWQRNYYEHIIRDDIAYFRIREYIRNNPLQWIHDSNNPEFSREK